MATIANDINEYVENSRNEYENTYSNSETVIGTWIDGKPIYRKVFTGTTPSNTSDIVIANIDDLKVDHQVNLYGTVDRGNSIGYLTIGMTLPNSVTGVCVYMHDSKKKLYIGQKGFANLPAVVVFEYTKTTDSATTNN